MPIESKKDRSFNDFMVGAFLDKLLIAESFGGGALILFVSCFFKWWYLMNLDSVLDPSLFSDAVVSPEP